MKSTHIARPYAKALLDFVVEGKNEDAVAGDMELVLNTCKESRELIALFKSPVIRESRKIKIVDAIFGSKISEISLRFLRIIIQKGRDAFIPEIAAQFISEYKKLKGILSSEIISAVAVDQKSRKEIISLLASYTGKEIELTEKTDPDLIGGFVLNFEDKRVDASVRSELEKLRNELVSR